MGFLGGALSAVASFIDGVANLIPSFKSDTGSLGSSVATMNDLLSKCNKFFPVQDVCIVLGLMIGIYIALNLFYWIQRAINLLRGAG